jgi:hypothetical protein
MSLKQAIDKFVRDESGQDLVEYALLLVFLARRNRHVADPGKGR